MKNIAIASVVPGLRVRSEMNAHEHWAAGKALADEQLVMWGGVP